MVPPDDRSSRPLNQKRWKEYRKKAGAALKDPRILKEISDRSRSKLDSHSDKFSSLKKDLSTLLDMILAYSKGHYRSVPWKSLLSGVAAVIYFLNPFDAIPDFIFGIGFLDDLTVVGMVLKSLGSDLANFREWQGTATEKKSPSENP